MSHSRCMSHTSTVESQCSHRREGVHDHTEDLARSENRSQSRKFLVCGWVSTRIMTIKMYFLSSIWWFQSHLQSVLLPQRLDQEVLFNVSPSSCKWLLYDLHTCRSCYTTSHCRLLCCKSFVFVRTVLIQSACHDEGYSLFGTANTATLCFKTDSAAWECNLVETTSQPIPRCKHNPQCLTFGSIPASFLETKQPFWCQIKTPRLQIIPVNQLINDAISCLKHNFCQWKSVINSPPQDRYAFIPAPVANERRNNKQHRDDHLNSMFSMEEKSSDSADMKGPGWERDIGWFFRCIQGNLRQNIGGGSVGRRVGSICVFCVGASQTSW